MTYYLRPLRWSATLMALASLNTGCLLHVPLWTDDIDLPGWGIEYRVLDLYGQPHDGGHLLIIYHVEPELLFVPHRRTRELHLYPIHDGIVKTPPKQVCKTAWFNGIDAWWGDVDMIDSYILVPGVDPIRSSPPDWSHGSIANGNQYSIHPNMSHGAPRILSPETIHDYLFQQPCKIHPTSNPYSDHIDLLKKIANADIEFKGYQTFGAIGDEINMIKKFALIELKRYGYDQ